MVLTHTNGMKAFTIIEKENDMNIIMKRVRLKDSKDEVRRMPEKQAAVLVKTGEYVYATRTEWKDAGRNMKG